jgi:hypothetical protein
MNERIEKLAEGCFEYFEPNCDGETMEFNYKKFAELIVQECADLFEVEWGDEKLTGNDVGYVLKKHFGVEE